MLGLYWENGKENGNYYNGLYRDYIRVILGLYWDNGKENGNYYNGFYRGFIGLCRDRKGIGFLGFWVLGLRVCMGLWV